MWWRTAGPTKQFTRIKKQDLDLVKPPPYDMSLERRELMRQEVRSLIDSLKPDGIDSGSVEVLNNLINAWADQQVAELEEARDERMAVSQALVGIANEQVARYRARYDADLALVAQTGAALAVTFEELTGRNASELIVPHPRRPTDFPVESSLGPVEPTDDTEEWAQIEQWPTADEYPPPSQRRSDRHGGDGQGESGPGEHGQDDDGQRLYGHRDARRGRFAEGGTPDDAYYR